MEYIWIGGSSLAQRLMKKWSRINSAIIPKVILDNDNAKKGMKMGEVLIDSVDNIFQYLTKETKIIITSTFITEIKQQLLDLKIENHIVDYKEMNQEIVLPFIFRNEELKKNKKNDRCFIIGNGPSLKMLDLKRLETQDKIMVNDFYKSEELLRLSPQFWMIADPLYWQKEILLYPKLDLINNHFINTKLLINEVALEYLNTEVINYSNVYYYWMGINDEYIDSAEKIDFQEMVPRFAQNVVSVSLMLAIYLEYKEIILIGCDHTWWGYSKEDIDRGTLPPHIYEQNAQDIKFDKEILKELSYEGLQKTIERQKYEYTELKRIAENQGIKIYNATPGGYLEIFERKDFNSFFKEQ